MGRMLRPAPLIALALLIAGCAVPAEEPPPGRQLVHHEVYELPPIEVTEAPPEKPGAARRAVGTALGFVDETALDCLVSLCWVNPFAGR